MGELEARDVVCGETNERERKAKEEGYARKIDDLSAQKDYAGVAALQAHVETLDSAVDQRTCHLNNKARIATQRRVAWQKMYNAKRQATPHRRAKQR